MTRNFPVRAVPKTSYGTYVNSGLPQKPSSNLRSLFGPIRNQGSLGACSAFGSTNWRSGLLVQEGGQYQVFSALAQYYYERLINGTVDSDSGATVQEAIQVLEQYGVMPDADWPYTNYLEDYKKEPPFIDFIKNLAIDPTNTFEVQQSNIVNDTIDALSRGFPVLFGFVVFPDLESAEVADNGLLPMPIIPPGQSPFFGNIGGHMVVIIGHDNATQQFLCMNQWGQDWGIKEPVDLQGCFWMPYAYYNQYAFNPMVYVQSPQPPQNYKLTIQATKNQANIREEVPVIVELTDNGKPMANEFIRITISDPPATLDPATNEQGKITYNALSVVPSQIIISATWVTPTGFSMVSSTTVRWINPSKPKPFPVKPVTEESKTFEVTVKGNDQINLFLKDAKDSNWAVKDM